MGEGFLELDMPIDYESELNSEQLAAVTSPAGPALVIAGAGVGKTRTLTYRVAYLLDQGIRPEQVLLLTFTNKSAREMLVRVNQLVKRSTIGLWGGTFHSICNRILRDHAVVLGYSQSFSILDRDDQKSLMREVISTHLRENKDKEFPKPDLLISIFSLAANLDELVENLLLIRYQYLEDYTDDILAISKLYEAQKKMTNSMDFDDLLINTLVLFEKFPQILQLYQCQFQVVLVDEYQDTNKVQSRFIDLLVANHHHLMAVGDDAQSIYSWRGANVDHLLKFKNRYPDAEVFPITVNYRSVPEVLTLANQIIARNSNQFKKSLHSVRDSKRQKPVFVSLKTPAAQAQFVADQLYQHNQAGVRWREMAVLYRSHYHALELQLELTQRNIAFEITSGLQFFQQAHIKDLVALLRFMVNPRDKVSFRRWLMLFPGVGNNTGEKFWKKWLESLGSSQELDSAVYTKLLRDWKMPKKAEVQWRIFVQALEGLASSDIIDQDEGKQTDGWKYPAGILSTALEEFYDQYMQVTYENYEPRRRELEQFITYSEGFESLTELLASLSLLGDMDTQTDQSANQAGVRDRVRLSSIHQAKGLEWKVVFVIWLADGMFPNRKVLESQSEASLEEERRLFYVAATRAKDELYLTYPQTNPRSYSGETFQRVSRFLEEVSPESVEIQQAEYY